MPSPVRPPDARRALELARTDRAAARKAIAELPLDAQVALVCETPVGRRAEVLELLSDLEAVVPQLPEAELCFTAKAIGLSDAGWLLALATDEQLATCLDLDAWNGLALERPKLDAWLEALADAGEDTLLRVSRALDAEVLVLELRSRFRVVLKPSDSEGDWDPPPGAQTIDGQFFFFAKRDNDDLSPILQLLDALFREDYWRYFRFMQAAIWELDDELEEYALRWRSGRLEDLGFPAWDEAMRIYGTLRPEDRTRIPQGPPPLGVGAWRLPVWIPNLPAAEDAKHEIFRAAARLGDDERRAFFYAFVALSNSVAVADRLALGDAESTPAAIEKAARLASLGLAHLAEAHGLPPTELLRRVSVERLFRVGASLDPSARPPVASPA